MLGSSPLCHSQRRHLFLSISMLDSPYLLIAKASYLTRPTSAWRGTPSRHTMLGSFSTWCRRFILLPLRSSLTSAENPIFYKAIGGGSPTLRTTSLVLRQLRFVNFYPAQTIRNFSKWITSSLELLNACHLERASLRSARPMRKSYALS